MTNVALTGLARDLAQRAAEGRPVRIGVVGCGEMGTDIVTQVAQMQGIEVAAIVARRPHQAHDAVRIAQREADSAVEVQTDSAISALIESGKTAIVPDADLLMNNGLIDVIVDATGKPVAGAEIGLKVIEHGKHLVMMNVEADVTVGAYLKQMADKMGVVYTVGAGDEPSSCMELIEFVTAMGHTVVAAGKGKNNPLNHDATPDDYREEAIRRNMNPRMLVEFVDGSKTMVEMTAIANATGLVPDLPGMHGPAATLEQLPKVLCPVEDGGILSRKGVVDYSVGKGVAPGVFVIAEMAHPRLRERMNDLKLGEGPYFTFFRPYHLTSLEVPLSCARAVMYGKADMVPLQKPVAEVCAVAKRDLAPGERLDAIGEYTYRSWAMSVGDARAANAVPCGLLEGGTVTAPIAKGELITYANAAPQPDSPLVALRRKQDEMVAALG
ncbi:NAD(P)H-dependent oxidoreductase [Aerobium aerolatum]|uniref:Predicted homoserine dehydrogenase, contains C-terminal SAF domain n=1 Tax=Aquamicrobium aerolatum DSM 21857 TaxID=1121003 RepID=A0A1I3H9Q0_9HYPH|nr:NAD(P)H-dependent oxidoreductase [Aquamicrobium aerolatum]SFI32393.1 Predicted homoserine dehydrogenase, contains C-terminal SAF domain [Aquamicrobium aerolatum DSM 21857]